MFITQDLISRILRLICVRILLPEFDFVPNDAFQNVLLNLCYYYSFRESQNHRLHRRRILVIWDGDGVDDDGENDESPPFCYMTLIIKL